MLIYEGLADSIFHLLYSRHPVPFRFKVIPRKEKDVEGLLAEYMNVEYI
jgi:hypothetical protein